MAAARRGQRATLELWSKNCRGRRLWRQVGSIAAEDSGRYSVADMHIDILTLFPKEMAGSAPDCFVEITAQRIVA